MKNVGDVFVVKVVVTAQIRAKDADEATRLAGFIGKEGAQPPSLRVTDTLLGTPIILPLEQYHPDFREPAATGHCPRCHKDGIMGPDRILPCGHRARKPQIRRSKKHVQVQGREDVKYPTPEQNLAREKHKTTSSGYYDGKSGAALTNGDLIQRWCNYDRDIGHGIAYRDWLHDEKTTGAITTTPTPTSSTTESE